MNIIRQKQHEKLLEAQESALPHLTIREMGNVLGIKSTSHVRYILDNLVDNGLAEKIQRGTTHVYRMVKLAYRHNQGKDHE